MLDVVVMLWLYWCLMVVFVVLYWIVVGNVFGWMWSNICCGWLLYGCLVLNGLLDFVVLVGLVDCVVWFGWVLVMLVVVCFFVVVCWFLWCSCCWWIDSGCYSFSVFVWFVWVVWWFLCGLVVVVLRIGYVVLVVCICWLFDLVVGWIDVRDRSWLICVSWRFVCYLWMYGMIVCGDMIDLCGMLV